MTSIDSRLVTGNGSLISTCNDDTWPSNGAKSGELSGLGGLQKQKTTKSRISDTLKLSIAKELFKSSKGCKKHTSSGSVSIASNNNGTNATFDLTASVSACSNTTGDDPDLDSDCEEPLAPAAMSKKLGDTRIAPRRTYKSCLKKGDGSSKTRIPPKRSVSADELNLQIRLPCQEKTITRTRSITFDQSVKVRRIPSAAELNQGNTAELWFQADEFNSIKRKTYALIRAIQQGETGGVNYCTRGLEKFFRPEEIQERRAAAWDIVFDEQEGQQHSGSFDDLRISQAYQNYTRKTMAEAAERGRLDHNATERYLKSTKQILRAQSVPTAMNLRMQR